MKAPVIARVVSAADGKPTPHDGRYVVAWDPHSPAGVLRLESSADRADAHLFADLNEAMQQRRTISSVQVLRPWDGKPNRPLTAVSVVFMLAYAPERTRH